MCVEALFLQQSLSTNTTNVPPTSLILIFMAIATLKFVCKPIHIQLRPTPFQCIRKVFLYIYISSKSFFLYTFTLFSLLYIPSFFKVVHRYAAYVEAEEAKKEETKTKVLVLEEGKCCTELFLNLLFVFLCVVLLILIMVSAELLFFVVVLNG